MLKFAPLLIMAAIWQLLVDTGMVSNLILPSIPQIGSAFWQILMNGDLLSHTGRSLYRAASGLSAAIMVGITIGVTMALWKPFRLVVNPIVQLFYPMPKSALIPVVMIWFGLGDQSKIILIFLGCLLPVVISTFNGVRGINPVLIWSAKSLGASTPATIIQIIIPAALPEILSGCRTALSFAFLLMVSSEFVIASDGVGYMISSLGDAGLYPAMFGVIFFVAFVGFLVDQIYSAVSRYQLRWRMA
ncbi:ABC transporter permease [Mesorhizobium sp. 10J20-29]